MPTYTITVIETVKKEFQLEAKTADEAEELFNGEKELAQPPLLISEIAVGSEVIFVSEKELIN